MKMDEIENLQFVVDDEILLRAALTPNENDCPSFDFDFDDLSLSTTVTSCTATTTTTNSDNPSAESNPGFPDKMADQSRFPVFSNQDLSELKSVAINKNTSRSTKHWLSVFNSWRESRHLEIDIFNMAPADLDEVLAQFYAEVKRKDGDDYEPESLKIMQSAIERHLKENNYPLSIVRGREFHNSQQILNAKAISLRQQGKGKRPNKSQPLNEDEESALWMKGELGDTNGRVLTNTNFKNLTEQLGLRGRQEHHDAYVEDFVLRNHEDGSESVEFEENPTKTRSGGLSIKRRTTKQIMWSTDGGEKDPVTLFKVWLSKRPHGMKDNGPLYLGIINRPKTSDVWYCKIRMGENTIGKIIKTIAACLKSDKKLTNHSMRKTLVSKLKKAGHPRHIIKEITGHARESSLDDYDEVDEFQRREISHAISGYQAPKSSNNTEPQRMPLQPVQNISQMAPNVSTLQNYPTMSSFPQYGGQFYPNSNAGFTPFPPQQSFNSMFWNQRMAPLSSPSTGQSYSSCTFNFFDNKQKEPMKKRRRAFILDSDDEDQT